MIEEELRNVFKCIVKKCDMLINNNKYEADDYTQDIVEDIAELCNHILDGDYEILSALKALDKNMKFELFGNTYKEVEDSCREYECKSCALLEICNITKPNLPCEKVDGSTNRHFILVDDEKPMEKRDLELEDRIFSGELELKSGKKLKISLLVGGLKADNPTEHMNNVVKRFGESEFEGKYNEFIEGTLDNPWFRILISDINDITDDDYEQLKERMNKAPDSDDIIKMIKGADKDTLAKIEQYIKKLKE